VGPVDLESRVVVFFSSFECNKQPTTPT